MKLQLAITGIGIQSPVGHSALAAVHAVRTNQSALSMLPLPDRTQQWITGSRIPRWTPFGARRQWETLAGLAMRQAWRHATQERAFGDGARVALVLGRPEPQRPSPVFPQTGFDADSWSAEWLGRAARHVDTVQAGACSAFAGLRIAARRFANGECDACAIGTVDSQAQLRVTRWHEEKSRLKCGYMTDGLIPGEAAAFIVVEPLQNATRRGAAVLAVIDAMAAELEEANVSSDQPNTAIALTNAVDAALQASSVNAEQLGMVWSDLNGESYRAREWAYVAVRLGLRDHTTLMHPADCHGDLGAATDVHLLALAAMAHATAWSEGKPLLVFAGSEGGIRAAAVLRHGMQAGRRAGVIEVSAGGVPRVMSTRFSVGDAPVAPKDFRETDDPLRTRHHWHTLQSQRDDLAALYYQRRAMLADRDVPWPRLAEPEQRMLALFDAVAAGGAPAMAFHAEGLSSDEEGVCFAAALLIGQIPSHENLLRLEHALGHAAGARREGLTQGLSHAPFSQTLRDAALRWLAGESPPALRAAALRWLARHRIAQPVCEPDDGADEGFAREFAEASWRLDWSDATGRLKNLLSHESPSVRRAALLALARFVPERAAMFCRARLAENAEFDGALAEGLGLCGTLDDAALLVAHAQSLPQETSALTALGTLGQVRAAPMLMSRLNDAEEPQMQAALDALRLIAGQPVGGDRTPQAWQRWWEQTGCRWPSGTRWRRGAAFVAARCIDELNDANATLPQRQRAHREIVRWTRSPIAYEADAFVPLQLGALGAGAC